MTAQTTAPHPATHPHTPVPSREIIPALLTPNPVSLIIAEDEHFVALQLVSDLKGLGYETIGPASDGQAALRLAREELPDLALLDIRMPNRTGIEVAEILFRELMIPAVIVTAYSSREEIQNASAAGVFGYLVKPASAEQLNAAVSVAWKRYVGYVTSLTECNVLRKRLEERALIERAKWLLVESQGMSEPNAHAHLRRAARDARKTMSEVARELIDKADKPAT